MPRRKKLIIIDLFCSDCNTHRSIAAEMQSANKVGHTESLWCHNCKSNRNFYIKSGYKTNLNIGRHSQTSRPRAYLTVHTERIVGLCNYDKHRCELNWATIYKKDCLGKKCNYFSWISLKDRDEWRQANGYEKRDKLCRLGTVKGRKAARHKENMVYLKHRNIKWEWINQKCEHILIDGYIDYYLGSTRWHNRRTQEFGYQMLYKLLKKSQNTLNTHPKSPL